MTLSKSEKTKLAIMDAAALVLSKHGDATLNEIAEAAGVGRATLHRHFKNREDLIRSLALKAIEDVKAVCRPALENAESARAALEQIIQLLIPLGHQYRFLGMTTVTYSDPEISAKYYSYLEDLTTLAGTLKSEGDIGADVPSAWIVAVIDALIYAAWFTVEDGYVAKRDAAPLALRTILSGLK